MPFGERVYFSGEHRLDDFVDALRTQLFVVLTDAVRAVRGFFFETGLGALVYDEIFRSEHALRFLDTVSIEKQDVAGIEVLLHNAETALHVDHERREYAGSRRFGELNHFHFARRCVEDMHDVVARVAEMYVPPETESKMHSVNAAKRPLNPRDSMRSLIRDTI